MGAISTHDTRKRAQTFVVVAREPAPAPKSAGARRTAPGRHRLADCTDGSPVVQRNAILKHEYRELENPAYTMAKHLGWATGLGPAAIFRDIDPVNIGAVPQTPTLARPDRVVALLDRRTGSGGRTAMITQIGRLGYLEEVLRNRGAVTDYNGGHLLALEFYNTWPLINDPSNLAPQRADDNKAPGEWRRAEIWLNVPAARVLYEASVSYPDRTYTVTAGGMARAMAPGSPTAIAAANMSYVTSWMPMTVHTWSPNQYAVAVTSLTSPTTHQTTAGWDLTNWVPGLHRVFSPIKGALTRMLPLFSVIERHQGIGGYLGAVDVRTQQQHPYRDALNEFKQLARDIAAITAGVAALSYLGIDLSWLAGFAASVPGIETLAAILPGFLGTAPLAAMVIYAITHQLNLTRLIPELPGLNWIKYGLGLLGL